MKKKIKKKTKTAVKPVKKPKKVKKPVKKYNNNKVEIAPDEYKPPKTYKILGYCPACDMVLSKKDFVSKMIFECPCGCRKHKKYLKAETKRMKQREALSKAQYLKDAAAVTKNAASIDHHSSNLPDISGITGKGKE